MDESIRNNTDFTSLQPVAHVFCAVRFISKVCSVFVSIGKMFSTIHVKLLAANGLLYIVLLISAF